MTQSASLAEVNKREFKARWVKVFKDRWRLRNHEPNAEGNRVDFAIDPLFEAWWQSRRTLAKPPAGWFLFGSHVDSDDVDLEFWGVGNDMLPLWERPAIVPEGSTESPRVLRSPHGYTPRGFVIYALFDHRDYLGSDPATFSVQESSIATERKVWVGQGDDRAHLTEDEARIVRDALTHFLDGDTPDADEITPETPTEGRADG